MGAAPQYKLTVSFEFGKRSRSRVSELRGRCQRQFVCLFGHIFEFEREVYTWLDVVV